MNVLRLGISPCPNDVYIFSGLILDKIPNNPFSFEIIYNDVENLNAHAQAGDLDVVKISYANFTRIADQYELLNCGGALGRGVGPLLLTHEGEIDPEREVLVPGEFTTANFLLDFYLQRQAAKKYIAFDALYEKLLKEPGTQGVVIHEKRFTYKQDGLTLIQDLGEHWESKTGNAIPLGAVVIRRDLDLRAKMETLIRKSLQWARANDAEVFELCRLYASDLHEEVIRAHIGLYVNDYSLDLGEEGRNIVDYFLAKQKEFLACE